MDNIVIVKKKRKIKILNKKKKTKNEEVCCALWIDEPIRGLWPVPTTLCRQSYQLKAFNIVFRVAEVDRSMSGVGNSTL